MADAHPGNPLVSEKLIYVPPQPDRSLVAYNPLSPAPVIKIKAPVIKIKSPKEGAVFSSSKVAVTYLIDNPGDAPISRIRALVDGIEKKVIQLNQSGFGKEAKLSVPVPEQDCKVCLIAETTDSVSSKPAYVTLKWIPAPTISIINPKDGTGFETKRVTLSYAIDNPSSEPVARIRVLVGWQGAKSAETRHGQGYTTQEKR